MADFTFITVKKEEMFDDLSKAFLEVQEKLAGEILKDIQSSLKWNRSKNSVELGEMSAVQGYISASVQSMGSAIIESYGTGKKMDLSNPALDEYIYGEFWNPLRTGTTIVGRPSGSYNNILGENADSTGSRAGSPTGGGIKPSYAIQNVEQRYFDTGIIWNRVESWIEVWLATNAFRYFTN